VFYFINTIFLLNIPAIFKIYINRIFINLVDIIYIIYLNNILIYSINPAEY